ncbi:MAG TPA: Type 1 glutamine amidotransferase-like domain-containing protein [Candidatus Dormibacteraeota bacterium]|jgi:cyanophycinase|nr:Type 1 glutamine amidotransferase-like domain-containing protein [Candidatus Dormibacteraeota bacterium]
MAGPLALVGGAEFGPGNEEQDRVLAAAAAGGPAYVVCAAVRSHPEQAVATARRWFATLGVEIIELRVRSRSDAAVPATVEAAGSAGLVYLAGGDPGRTVQLLSGTAVWDAIVSAWRGGAALAGSSAGAMALCRWTLIRDRWPDHTTRRAVDALTVVPDCAVLPHFDTFGERWIPSAQGALGAGTILVGVDERSAAVWRGDRWSAAGPGAVTVVVGDARSRFASGETIAGIPAPDGRPAA